MNNIFKSFLVLLFIVSFFAENNGQEKNKFPYPIIGEELELGNFKFVVNKSEFIKELKNLFYTKKADGVYLIVYMTVTNMTKENRTLSSSMFNVVDKDEVVFETSDDALNALVLEEPDKVFLFKDIPPRIPKPIIIPFEVPSKTIYGLKLSGGYGTNQTGYIVLMRDNEYK